MWEWEISIGLAKNIGKYHVWLVITSENIGFITSGRRPWVINPIFSQVMTITTSDIFQYFCQPCNNYIHKLVVKWHFKSGKICIIIFLGPLLMELHFLFLNGGLNSWNLILENIMCSDGNHKWYIEFSAVYQYEIPLKHSWWHTYFIASLTDIGKYSSWFYVVEQSLTKI